MPSVNRGVDPTTYVEESDVAVTSMLASGQGAVGSLTGTNAGVLATGVATAVAAGLALADTAGLGLETGSELDPPPISHQRPINTVSATNATAPRRTQYTVGASGPTGDIIPLTAPTVVAARMPHATIPSWRDDSMKSLQSSTGLNCIDETCRGAVPTFHRGASW